MHPLGLELDGLGCIGNGGSDAVAQPIRQPHVLGFAPGDPLLMLEDLDNRADPPEGEAAVSAIARVVGPWRPNPVVMKPVVQIVFAIGAEDAWFIQLVSSH